MIFSFTSLIRKTLSFCLEGKRGVEWGGRGMAVARNKFTAALFTEER